METTTTSLEKTEHSMIKRYWRFLYSETRAREWAVTNWNWKTKCKFMDIEKQGATLAIQRTRKIKLKVNHFANCTGRDTEDFFAWYACGRSIRLLLMPQCRGFRVH